MWLIETKNKIVRLFKFKQQTYDEEIELPLVELTTEKEEDWELPKIYEINSEDEWSDTEASVTSCVNTTIVFGDDSTLKYRQSASNSSNKKFGKVNFEMKMAHLDAIDENGEKPDYEQGHSRQGSFGQFSFSSLSEASSTTAVNSTSGFPAQGSFDSELIDHFVTANYLTGKRLGNSNVYAIIDKHGEKLTIPIGSCEVSTFSHRHGAYLLSVFDKSTSRSSEDLIISLGLVDGRTFRHYVSENGLKRGYLHVKEEYSFASRVLNGIGQKLKDIECVGNICTAIKLITVTGTTIKRVQLPGGGFDDHSYKVTTKGGRGDVILRCQARFAPDILDNLAIKLLNADGSTLLHEAVKLVEEVDGMKRQIISKAAVEPEQATQPALERDSVGVVGLKDEKGIIYLRSPDSTSWMIKLDIAHVELNTDQIRCSRNEIGICFVRIGGSVTYNVIQEFRLKDGSFLDINWSEDEARYVYTSADDSQDALEHEITHIMDHPSSDGETWSHFRFRDEVTLSFDMFAERCKFKAELLNICRRNGIPVTAPYQPQGVYGFETEELVRYTRRDGFESKWIQQVFNDLSGWYAVANDRVKFRLAEDGTAYLESFNAWGTSECLSMITEWCLLDGTKLKMTPSRDGGACYSSNAWSGDQLKYEIIKYYEPFNGQLDGEWLWFEYFKPKMDVDHERRNGLVGIKSKITARMKFWRKQEAAETDSTMQVTASGIGDAKLLLHEQDTIRFMTANGYHYLRLPNQTNFYRVKDGEAVVKDRSEIDISRDGETGAAYVRFVNRDGYIPKPLDLITKFQLIDGRIFRHFKLGTDEVVYATKKELSATSATTDSVSGKRRAPKNAGLGNPEEVIIPIAANDLTAHLKGLENWRFPQPSRGHIYGVKTANGTVCSRQGDTEVFIVQYPNGEVGTLHAAESAQRTDAQGNHFLKVFDHACGYEGWDKIMEYKYGDGSICRSEKSMDGRVVYNIEFAVNLRPAFDAALNACAVLAGVYRRKGRILNTLFASTDSRAGQAFFHDGKEVQGSISYLKTKSGVRYELQAGEDIFVLTNKLGGKFTMTRGEIQISTDERGVKFVDSPGHYSGTKCPDAILSWGTICGMMFSLAKSNGMFSYSKIKGIDEKFQLMDGIQNLPDFRPAVFNINAVLMMETQCNSVYVRASPDSPFLVKTNDGEVAYGFDGAETHYRGTDVVKDAKGMRCVKVWQENPVRVKRLDVIIRFQDKTGKIVKLWTDENGKAVYAEKHQVFDESVEITHQDLFVQDAAGNFIEDPAPKHDLIAVYDTDSEPKEPEIGRSVSNAGNLSLADDSSYGDETDEMYSYKGNDESFAGMYDDDDLYDDGEEEVNEFYQTRREESAGDSTHAHPAPEDDRYLSAGEDKLLDHTDYHEPPESGYKVKGRGEDVGDALLQPESMSIGIDYDESASMVSDGRVALASGTETRRRRTSRHPHNARYAADLALFLISQGKQVNAGAKANNSAGLSSPHEAAGPSRPGSGAEPSRPSRMPGDYDVPPEKEDVLPGYEDEDPELDRAANLSQDGIARLNVAVEGPDGFSFKAWYEKTSKRPKAVIPKKLDQFVLGNGIRYDRNLSGGDKDWILTLPDIRLSENVFNCKSTEIEITMNSQACDIVDLDSMEVVRAAAAAFYVAAYHEDGTVTQEKAMSFTWRDKKQITLNPSTGGGQATYVDDAPVMAYS